MSLRRREFLGALGFAPYAVGTSFGALSLTACVHKEDTPLAHLYGPDWVHGAYGLYAQKYASIQASSEDAAQNAYAAIAQKGVTALADLQTREVPFFIRVEQSENGFSIARDTPARLTFTAGMTEADRAAAEARWEKNRDTIQTDYEQIRRLDWALTTLLHQLQRVRSSIEAGTLEEYRIVRQVTALQQGGEPPFDLPYQVSVTDYRDVLLLLLERLDDDAARLTRLESDIVTVGLTTRATDAGSGSLSDNLNKVLLAVVTDATTAATTTRPATYPEAALRLQYASRGQQLFASISADPLYIQWEKRESTKVFDSIGQILTVLDSVTGLHASAIYQQALDIWRGDADYLSYLKMLLKTFPAGREIVKVAEQAIALTEKARALVQKGERVVGQAEAIVAQGKAIAGQAQNAGAMASALADRGIVQIGKDSGLLNAGSDFARQRIGKQLAFLKDAKELDTIKSMLADSPLLSRALPALQ